ncbi:MAG: activase [Candidatus Neomarinimicrobiota bacterium]|nr:MAG: activase [Candidatus Neomarinimicrobiota bacterium]
MKEAVGICVGASTISCVRVRAAGGRAEIQSVHSQPHDGNPRAVFQSLLASLNLPEQMPLAVTGRRFKDLVALDQIAEPQAVELALKHVNGHGPFPEAVISAGAETFILYQLDSRGRVTRVYTGNKCASGTGEFFLQQIRRLDVPLEEADRISRDEKPFPVSGRCSVFCKSDCTHATNIGIPKGQVLAGLSRMMAQKVLELAKATPLRRVMLIGGTTRITAMVKVLEEEIESLTIPEEATYFEALGSALYALTNDCRPWGQVRNRLFRSRRTRFDFHPPLQEWMDRVTFKSQPRGIPRAGDRCVLGLDVGSTTTKAVLLRADDLKIIAAEYLRTNGDPVTAARNCYRALANQLQGVPVDIFGCGVTGSGRKIAGLHAQTDGVINEIIAHAEAAIHFDPEVDTIFEIGGQDAKYTYITNGVASDYAMNEACSAGTGSFLEESAWETLGIPVEEIADWALQGKRPPNFNDQCAAFIASDIKSTSQEGIPREDIVAGLVYSICLNYVNRVKGARPVGRKVFMQGGVCYNRAVPVAMAALSGKEIIVPPEPGLMGAYGVALEVLNRIRTGLMKAQSFDLTVLAGREVAYKDPIICRGGKEKCDLSCEITRVVIDDKTIPFGGACNRFYNLRQKLRIEPGEYDFVLQRQRIIFEEMAPPLETLPDTAPRVGLSRSLLMNTFYPLFAHFFAELGFRPVLAEAVDPEGVDQCAAAFCFPCEIAHGYFHHLVRQKPDFIFLPHIKGLLVPGGTQPSRTCPLVQGEPFYLKNTFLFQREDAPPVLTPTLDLGAALDEQLKAMERLSVPLGVPEKRIREAYTRATAVQEQVRARLQALGQRALRFVEADPERLGVILFGRPYNACAPEANKGIPHKFASRGITVIPVDCLDLETEPVREHMYWAMGQINLKGAEFIRRHPQLFGTYITNFSCGPDSFIVGYFRDILGKKPSLTLELDNHTADAGLETRIEAFLDIVVRYRKLEKDLAPVVKRSTFRPARSRLKDGVYTIYTSDGEITDLWDPRVKLVFCSMGRFSAESIAATYRGMGIRTHVLPELTEEELKRGRGQTSCKECLPLQLTLGGLIRYLEQDREPEEITVYFMPTADGPCRFGQYLDFSRDYIRKKGIPDVTFFTMSADDGYGGLGTRFTLRIWKALILADLFEDIFHTLQVAAVDREAALETFEAAWSRIKAGLSRDYAHLNRAVMEAADLLAGIPKRQALEDFPQVLIVGEIYVRKEGISRRWLPERLIEAGIIPFVAPIHEWGMYVDWLYQHNLVSRPPRGWQRVGKGIERQLKIAVQRRLKTLLSKSGWLVPRYISIPRVVRTGEQFLTRNLTGEAILTTGGPVAEVGDEFCGAIAIGPFGCMPNRLSEALLNLGMDRDHVLAVRSDAHTRRLLADQPHLPFLAIESDGNPFPQVIEARLETFILQAKRMHAVMRRFQGATDRRSLSFSGSGPASP